MQFLEHRINLFCSHTSILVGLPLLLQALNKDHTDVHDYFGSVHQNLKEIGGKALIEAGSTDFSLV